jgi:hypothetical protein
MEICSLFIPNEIIVILVRSVRYTSTLVTMRQICRHLRDIITNETIINVTKEPTNMAFINLIPKVTTLMICMRGADRFPFFNRLPNLKRLIVKIPRSDLMNKDQVVKLNNINPYFTKVLSNSYRIPYVKVYFDRKYCISSENRTFETNCYNISLLGNNVYLLAMRKLILRNVNIKQLEIIAIAIKKLKSLEELHLWVTDQTYVPIVERPHRYEINKVFFHGLIIGTVSIERD